MSLENMVVRLLEWSVVAPNGDPYHAPEFLPRYLHGIAENHPDFPPGTRVTTSRIKAAKGRVVQTGSRSYELVGPPAGGYFEYLLQCGIALDPHEPVKVRG